MPTVTRKDLVVLVADKNMQFALNGILNRHQALNIREITYTVIPFVSRNDPGCYKEAHNFLQSHSLSYSYALVLFDYEGCGQEGRSVPEIEDEVKRRLMQSGWADRASVIVIKPELEVLVWSDSPEVSQCLGWNDPQQSLRAWLEQQAVWQKGDQKPTDPRLALEKVLHKLRKPRSSKLYGDLANSVSFQRCIDPSFDRLRQVLRTWFGNISHSE
jgi:hypothetical protein